MRPAREWTTPEDLRAQVQRHWDSGRILAAMVSGEALFPLELRLWGPGPGELGGRFDEARRWMRALEEGSRERRGHGYALDWAEVDNRLIGRNRVARGAHVPTEDDALRLLRKTAEAQRFRALVGVTLEAFPGLRDWLARKALVVLEHAHEWEQVLAVLRCLREHPRPGVYLRQLDIPGVDTKFIEQRRGLLAQLLDRVLAPEEVDARCTGAAGFEGRYGLRTRPPLVRVRFLDERLWLQGLSDVTVPVAELARVELPGRRVFVTENEVNFLAFPAVPGALVVFGAGYAVERLGPLRWLGHKEVHYWGDLDTHGFAMLARLRTCFPHVTSFLMDRETLMAHRPLWVQEQEPHRGALAGLTAEEQELYGALRSDALGERVRLEQERIAFGRVMHAVAPMGG
jgi:hypothetical protein